jgi:hypothetical protein
MAAYETQYMPDGSTLTIVAAPVVGLDLRPYVEYRLEERDSTGAWLGFCAMGSLPFVREALQARVAAATAPCGASWHGLREGNPDCGCGWGDLCTYAAALARRPLTAALATAAHARGEQ